ncbi:hypothetical protein BKA82DRAFT_4013054 [Pisolithus tinctorius]|nr:hypothetical protein BKA82DRAFT_4013054 [Pisolithus tinctorius]
MKAKTPSSIENVPLTSAVRPDNLRQRHIHTVAKMESVSSNTTVGDVYLGMDFLHMSKILTLKLDQFSLRCLEQFPYLEAACLQVLVMVEDELHRVDAIQQAAWNGFPRRDLIANSGQIQGVGRCEGAIQSDGDEQSEEVEKSSYGSPNKESCVFVNTDRRSLLKFPRV